MDKILIVVVFPAPLWPSTAQIEPVGTAKLTSCNAWTVPANVLDKPITSITKSDDTVGRGAVNAKSAFAALRSSSGALPGLGTIVGKPRSQCDAPPNSRHPPTVPRPRS